MQKGRDPQPLTHTVFMLWALLLAAAHGVSHNTDHSVDKDHGGSSDNSMFNAQVSHGLCFAVCLASLYCVVAEHAMIGQMSSKLAGQPLCLLVKLSVVLTDLDNL